VMDTRYPPKIGCIWKKTSHSTEMQKSEGISGVLTEIRFLHEKQNILGKEWRIGNRTGFRRN
jgi:hypothetical protein